jgi:hypothetical protein
MSLPGASLDHAAPTIVLDFEDPADGRHEARDAAEDVLSDWHLDSNDNRPPAVPHLRALACDWRATLLRDRGAGERGEFGGGF